VKRVASAAELYAHAIAIEREADERYAECAERMEDLGNPAVEVLLARTSGVALPALAAHEYRWLDAGAPETAARELVFRFMTPRQALSIALRAARRAQAFFEHVLMTAADPALRALAREMAAEEAEHSEVLERILEKVSKPLADWINE
jgi:rubrerythrin